MRRHLLKSGELFEDPDFPCIQSSVFYHESPPFNFVWKRPFELVSDPKFLPLSNPPSNVDLSSILGRLGDPWFVSSVALLHQLKGLFYRVVPADQSFDSTEYAGIFRFRLWWFGQWQEVVVDDRLPTVNNKLVFVHALNGSVFWTCLLEKAIAKLHGSYEALKYGTTLEALSDMTGGVSEVIDLKSEDPLSSRILVQRLLNITSIVTAVVSAEEAQRPEFNLDHHGNHNSNRKHLNHSTSSSSPPQFLYPSASPPSGNSHFHHRSGINGVGDNIPRKTRDKTSSASSSSSSEAPLHSSYPYNHGSGNHYSFNEDSLGEMSTSSTSSNNNPSPSDTSPCPFPRSVKGISACVNYRITAIERVEISEGDNRDQLFLLRLTNPLGANRNEYRGDFGSKSCPRWRSLSDSDRLRIESMDDETSDEYFDEFYFQDNFSSGSSGGNNKDHRNNGVFMSKSVKQSRRRSSSFWMEWTDFTRVFSHLEVVFLDGETARDEPSLREGVGTAAKFPMTVKLYRGVWRRGVTAGGCRNNGDTFHQNPQLEITLQMESDDMVVCCLNQHSVLEPQVVGFSIYSSPGNALSKNSNGSGILPLKEKKDKCNSTSSERLDKGFFRKNKSLLNSSYSNSRQVVLRCALDRGTFIVLPTSFEAGYEGVFTFRVYCMKGVKLRVLDGYNEVLKTPILKSPASFDNKFSQYEQLFTQVSDEHKTVNCHDLQELLEASLPNDYVKSCATIDVCRLIISAVDTTGFGRLHFKDYKNIMCSLRFWQNTFKNHTKGTTGILRVERLEEALNEVGFRVSTEVLSLLVLKFMRKDSTLRFGDFVAAVLHLTVSFNLWEKHNRQSHQKGGSVTAVSNNGSSIISHQLAKMNLHSCLSLNDWLKLSLHT